MLMPLRVPISTLRIFEAAARRRSFHAAAMELNLTPSAVSHSIRKMEEALGVVLFERIGRGVTLSEETVTPLRTPHMAATIESPADLFRYQLIQSDNKQVRWPAWFELNGIAVPASPRGSRFDRSFLAIAAAADGLGVALESTLLAEREIARGRLVAPLAGRSQDMRYVGHHLVYPPPAEQRPPLRLFAQWLARELDIVLTPFV